MTCYTIKACKRNIFAHIPQHFSTELGYAALIYYAVGMELVVLLGALTTVTVTYMAAWYGIARLTGRFDVVDSAWGLGFMLVAWTSLVIVQNFSTVAVVSACLTSLWGIRLFVHIANRNWRKHEDDHRYQVLLDKWGGAANRKMFTNVFLLQGALILLVSLPMVAIAHSDSLQPNLITWIGWAIWLSGILFETIADSQLAHFIKSRPKGAHTVMTGGLWRYSRHPNYFGEIVTWWGAALVAASVGQWWGVLGAITITILITKVSGLPPLEKHYAQNAEYQKYAKKTSILVPMPPR